MEKKGNVNRVLVGKPERKSHLEYLDLDGRIILKLERGGKALTGLIWLRCKDLLTGCVNVAVSHRVP
jgi:hypothetical protein